MFGPTFVWQLAREALRFAALTSILHKIQIITLFLNEEIRPMLRMVVLIVTFLLGVVAVAAQQDQVKATQAVMKGNGKNAAALGAMAKGEKPYDQPAVDAAMAQFEETVQKFPTLFPDSIKGLKPDGDYSASQKVWEDRTGFNEQVLGFSKVVADAKGKIKDLDSLKATLPTISKQCGGCHEGYRIKM
jgi:cytochrome c556